MSATFTSSNPFGEPMLSTVANVTIMDMAHEVWLTGEVGAGGGMKQGFDLLCMVCGWSLLACWLLPPRLSLGCKQTRPGRQVPAPSLCSHRRSRCHAPRPSHNTPLLNPFLCACAPTFALAGQGDDDGLPDFLTDENADAGFLPDHVHSSQHNTVYPVAAFAASSGALTAGEPSIQTTSGGGGGGGNQDGHAVLSLTVDVAQLSALGDDVRWAYLQVATPQAMAPSSRWRLARVQRPDGTAVKLPYNAWTS